MSAVLDQPVAETVTKGAIRIDDVVKIYDPDGAAVMAVDHCSIDIPAGEICMIVGPSGCGKTNAAKRDRRISRHYLRVYSPRWRTPVWPRATGG